MTFLGPGERQTLAAVCDTLVPSLPGEGGDRRLLSLGAADLCLEARVEEAIQVIARPRDRFLLRLFLRLLEKSPANALLSGRRCRFSQAPLEMRTAILLSWADSRLPLRRQAFQALKRLALFLFYSLEPDDEPNPTWTEIGYEPSPAPRSGETRRLEPLRIREAATLEAEVLVVGSGAGGGVVAAELAAQGRDVLILEKGGYRDIPDFHGRELAANEALFERQGGLTTSDMSMVVLAGSTLGGGTVVNWSTSLPTPQVVRREWAVDYGFEGVDGGGYDRSLEAVLARLSVDVDESDANPHNEVLARGGERLRLPVEVIPRNVDGCVDCTYCGFGCRYRAKQSALETYLPDAAAAGARIVVDAHVDRILYEHGRVTGVQATVTTNSGTFPMKVRAGAVVLAAGALHSPAIMLRSGLRNPNLGRHLRLHPVTAPIGIYDQPVPSWKDKPQTRLIDAFADLDGRGFGYRLEVAPAHPGLWASALPWTSGRAHKDLMSQVSRLANIICIVRDRGGGHIELDREGQPVPHYQLHAYDADHLLQGMLQAIRLHRAAGAKVILSPHQRPAIFRQVDRDFEGYLERVKSRGLAANTFGLFSAHQLGSCRVSGDRRRGVVRPDGESWELENLYVADGSVFPTACGVNPMIPIAATSHFLAQRIKSKLG